jgi:polar amino acid transport system substrate-binding protein
LRTGVDGTFAPHAMPKMDGGVEGFNIDLANEIAKRLGRKITIEATQFSGLIPALQAGTYDFVAAPTTVTKERAESLLFTEGYLNSDFQFVIPAGSPDITDLSQLKGKVIAVNKGSDYDSWAHELVEKIGWKVESYGTNTDAIQAVLSGRADANIGGNTASAWAVKNNPRLKLSYLYSTGLTWAIPFRKDSKELRDKVEIALECMKTDGTTTKLSEKWFGVTPAPGSAAVTVQPGYGVPGMPGYDPTIHPLSCN